MVDGISRPEVQSHFALVLQRKDMNILYIALKLALPVKSVQKKSNKAVPFIGCGTEGQAEHIQQRDPLQR